MSRDARELRRSVIVIVIIWVFVAVFLGVISGLHFAINQVVPGGFIVG